MDNITHGLVGLLIAQAAVHLVRWRRAPHAKTGTPPPDSATLAKRARPGGTASAPVGTAESANQATSLASASPSSPRAGEPDALPAWAAWVSAIANNLPDLDVAYAPVTGGKIAYLLHHRGHTHTLPFALLAGVLVAIGAAAWARLRRRRFSALEWRVLLALAFIGPLVHILLDYGNDYGVHPFWPFDSRWFYGGAVFIVEPWLWAFSIPPLFLATRRLIPRALLALILLFGIALAFIVSFVSLGARIALCAGAAAFVIYCATQRRRTIHCFWVGATGCVILLGTFWTSASVADKWLLKAAAAAGFTDEHILAGVLTPSPGNPVCFSAILVTARADQYELRTASVSTLPALTPAEECRIEPRGATLRLQDLPLRAHADSQPTSNDHLLRQHVAFQQHWVAPLNQLHTLQKENCQFRAFLRFARAPFWLPHSADTWIVGDLRYDRGPEIEFAELITPRVPRTCPDWVPPWTPPLQRAFQ